MISKIRVKLVDSPQVQGSVRGAGAYGQQLTAALGQISDVEITDRRPDIIHFLYFDPFFLTLPPFRPAKTVVTVFDLIPIALPRLYLRGIRGEIKWQVQKRLLKTVAAVITISHSAKKDIARFAGIPEEKIHVTHLAAGKQCRPLNLKREDMILYIGDVNPNKNLSTLLKAVALVPKAKLILAGKAFLEYNLPEARALREEIERLGIKDRVEMPGFVTEEEKVKLLNTVKVYVQPSIYEGFGLPVLEAMACGTPVVCGQNSSLPEVAGEAAIHAKVVNPEDLAGKLLKLFKLPKDEREKLSEKCLLQAQKFSWEKTARQTYEVYKTVLGQ